MGGRATPVEIALKAQVTLDQANELLQNMQKGGYAELEVTESGTIIYQFRGFISIDDRQNTIKINEE